MVIYQYIMGLVKFSMSGKKLDCVLLYFDETKVVGKTVCGAMCEKCGKEKQGLVARIMKIKKNLFKFKKSDLNKDYILNNSEAKNNLSYIYILANNILMV